MKFKLLIILLLISMVVGCKNTLPEEFIYSFPEEFIYSFEMNSIEEEDQDEIQRWLNEPDQTTTRTYEVYDEINGRYFVYAHSRKFSEVNVEQKDDAIRMMFRNEKVDGSGKDAFVKIKFNPDIIKNFVLDTEETE